MLEHLPSICLRVITIHYGEAIVLARAVFTPSCMVRGHSDAKSDADCDVHV